jgi:hypothetical protein
MLQILVNSNSDAYWVASHHFAKRAAEEGYTCASSNNEQQGRRVHIKLQTATLVELTNRCAQMADHLKTIPEQQ